MRLIRFTITVLGEPVPGTFAGFELLWDGERTIVSGFARDSQELYEILIELFQQELDILGLQANPLTE